MRTQQRHHNIRLNAKIIVQSVRPLLKLKTLLTLHYFFIPSTFLSYMERRKENMQGKRKRKRNIFEEGGVLYSEMSHKATSVYDDGDRWSQLDQLSGNSNTYSDLLACFVRTHVPYATNIKDTHCKNSVFFVPVVCIPLNKHSHIKKKTKQKKRLLMHLIRVLLRGRLVLNVREYDHGVFEHWNYWPVQGKLEKVTRVKPDSQEPSVSMWLNGNDGNLCKNYFLLTDRIEVPVMNPL